MKKVKIYLDQIPEGYRMEDYPAHVDFVWECRPPKRDPETFRLIWPGKRPLIYPEDVK